MSMRTHSFSSGPLRRAVAIICLMASIALFVFGLFLPIMTVRKGFLLFHSTQIYSIVATVEALWVNRDVALMGIVVGFSIVFPLWKYWVCLRFLFGNLRPEAARRLLHALRLLGKWSMLDVFVIAMLIVIIKVNGLVEVRSSIGLYYFGGSVITSMLLTSLLDLSMIRAFRSRPVPYRPLH